MTSKLTREQATDKELQMLIDSHEKGTAMFLRVDAYYLMAKELQERRKAEKDSEPVAYIDKQWTLVYYIPPMSMGLKIGDKLYRHAQPATECEHLAIENFRSAMEGIGHIRRTLEETFGGLHGTYVEPDVLAECKAICDAICASYCHAQPAPVVPVVPEEWAIADAVNFCKETGRQDAGAVMDAWNACRSAMLNGGKS